MHVRFVWDEDKNRENQRKHRVSFEEAVTIFAGLPLEVFYDPDHSTDEDRYIAVGVSEKSRVLLVVHCENETGSVVRVISARKATKQEQNSAFGRTWS
ncbi:MAG: hypothetical protein A2289_13540 [Deltaproteobacteria bacterium RIFOXYA12_FULL_58_15]|nr:MAG: hypothetical protein A2289_13540 [Deltaproteobacteria bacterium RIFOXYA12_FULL_58_15]OGR09546.1 MAG: hypothetical protein A2341_16685 [Deltaproteobacteria bacterium RIFOXYB12_FULL_58_9]